MTVRLYGAVAATVLGLCALVAFAFVALSPASVAVQAPPDALLVSGLGGSDDGAQGSAPNRLPARVPTDESYNASQASPFLAAPAPKTMPRSAPKAPPAAPSVEASLEPSPADTRPPATLDDDVAKSPAVIPPQPKAPPKPAPRVVDHRYDGVFTVEEIRRLKGAMRLSPDQEPYWGPVAGLLRDIGRQQMAQIDAGRKPEVSMDMSMMQRFYSAASPLLQSLREDQKAEIRKRARDMGLGAYASYI